MVVYVDNAAGISFQHDTCASSKLRGVYDQRSDWIKELKDQESATAVKVKTEKNLADLFTKCHTLTVRKRLQQELEQLAKDIAAKQSVKTV